MSHSSAVTVETPVDAPPVRPQSATWLGHPRGMYLVAFAELWERFSYWGLVGLLVIFLTASPSNGGWGWDNARALQLYGWYAGLAFALPALGAWVANSVISERRCIAIGGIVILCGHVLLAMSPSMAHWYSGGEGPNAAGTAIFLVGLALVLLGTGLLKPAISSIVAGLYPESGARRDEGFTWFFTAIYIGAAFGAIVVGYLGERIGWHYGFGAAAIGMALGMLAYLTKQNAWLGDIGAAAPIKRQHSARPLTRVDWERIGVIGVQGLFTIIYAAAFYQMFGMLALYSRDRLDRFIGGFEVPVTWLQTVNLWSFFLCVPLLSAAWRKLSRQHRNPSASYKLSFGIGSLAIGYLVLVAAESGSGPDLPSVLWLIGAYVLFGLGDSLVWANQISLTSKLAPLRYRPLLVGGWYICIGIGTWLTSYIGMLAEHYSFRTVFIQLACGCAIAALLLALLTPLQQRFMHGAEDTGHE
ncbi:peptide MFS transporter [Steroidobacter sp.]|uniref:peptide MFS transporter n=1 Tax=Steroidobacter sp. TaxID=1978227 RepID=UPI001A59D42E|nr:peptide MFS transporter [Steroidobacter sp.]MBL8268987.1 peptide MFS transporter [Steroidobacter sp.]